MKNNEIGLRKSNFTFIQVLNYIKNSSELRIRNFIKALARDYGQETPEAPGLMFIPFPLSNLEIAELTSTDPKQVKEVLNDLKAQGIISFLDKKLQIRT